MRKHNESEIREIVRLARQKDNTVAMQGYDLSGPGFCQIDLHGADLRDAHLRGTDLQSARLEGADLKGVRYDEYTRWPIGFNPRETGAV